MLEPFLYTSIYKFSNNQMPITALEKEWSKNLFQKRAREYSLSRGYARNMLSLIYKIPPLEIPLNSPPGKIPKMGNNLGFLSISHCKNAALISLSQYPVGVDIERKNRDFLARKILNKYYSEEEKKLLKNINSSRIRESVLNLWVIKEAAFKLSNGTLIDNLNKLIFNEKYKTIENKKREFKKRIYFSEFKEWKFAIAYDLRLSNLVPIICFVE